MTTTRTNITRPAFHSDAFDAFMASLKPVTVGTCPNPRHGEVPAIFDNRGTALCQVCGDNLRSVH